MSNFAGIFVLSNDLVLLGARTSLSGQDQVLNMCSQQYFYHVSLLGLFMNILHITHHFDVIDKENRISVLLKHEKVLNYLMTIIHDELGGAEIHPFPPTPCFSTLWHVYRDTANHSTIFCLMFVFFSYLITHVSLNLFNKHKGIFVFSIIFQ